MRLTTHPSVQANARSILSNHSPINDRTPVLTLPRYRTGGSCAVWAQPHQPAVRALLVNPSLESKNPGSQQEQCVLSSLIQGHVLTIETAIVAA